MGGGGSATGSGSATSGGGVSCVGMRGRQGAVHHGVCSAENGSLTPQFTGASLSQTPDSSLVQHFSTVVVQHSAIVMQSKPTAK